MLKIAGLTKTYGNRSVLQDLHLTIGAAEIYGLLGPNGAGKTTTINILCGLLRADRGSLEIQGQPPSIQTRRLIGVAPQETLLYRSLTCAENLQFFASLYGLRGIPQRQRIAECLELVGLGDRAHTVAETLSGGMQRRLSLAIALIHHPKLLILDEPTTGLDIEARYEVWNLIRSLHKQGTAVLLTTHLLDEAERLCQRIGILKQGRILAEGSLAELRQRVPAAEIVLIQTDQEAAVLARATELGWQHRCHGQELALWLPEVLELKEILSHFDGIPIASIARQPVRLEHIYLEVTNTNQGEAG